MHEFYNYTSYNNNNNSILEYAINYNYVASAAALTSLQARNKQAMATALLDKEATVLHEGEKVLVEEETLLYTETTEQSEAVIHKEFTWHNDPHKPLHFGLSFTTQNSPTPTTWYFAPDSSEHRIKISSQPTYPFTKQEPRTVEWIMLQPAITGQDSTVL